MSFPDADVVERAAEIRDEVLLEEYGGHHAECRLYDWSPILGAMKAEYGCECDELRRRDREAAREDQADRAWKESLGE